MKLNIFNTLTRENKSVPMFDSQNHKTSAIDNNKSENNKSEKLIINSVHKSWRLQGQKCSQY